MNLLNTSAHLDGTEPVTVTHSAALDILLIGTDPAGLRLVLPHHLSPAARVAFLTKLSDAASDLADEINLRDIEAAS